MQSDLLLHNRGESPGLIKSFVSTETDTWKRVLVIIHRDLFKVLKPSTLLQSLEH